MIENGSKAFKVFLCYTLSIALGSVHGQTLHKGNPLVVVNETLSQPKWVSDFPMVFIGTWDVKPTFRQRVGGNPVWQPAEYEKVNTEETVKKFKEMGVTFLMIHFYKGFGLEAEKKEIADSKKMAALCKKYGLKVGVYVGSTMAFETFLAEMPTAKDWIAPDYLGQAPTYGNQLFRKLVYFQHPGYKAYIKRVLRIAVEEMKVDLIHFDNSSIQATPPVFLHPIAVQNFRTFLNKKYSPAMLKRRLGFSNVSYVEPPVYNKPVTMINDPLWQEFTDFRCQQLADYYKEMGAFIRGINPECAVEMNPHGLSAENKMWDQSVDFPRLLAHSDFFWIEDERTQLREDTILVSQIRTFKMARTLNNRTFTYTSDSKLQMAESMAYNRQSIGMIGGREEMEGGRPGSQYTLDEDQAAYIKFFNKNFEYYRKIKSVANVAVLRTFATMAFNNERPYQSTFLFEQALIQNKIPFDIIFDDNLKELSKYEVLILADQECLNDEKQDLIRNFVSQGGGLVASEHTSLFTEWRERKPDYGLKDLLHVTAPEWRSRTIPDVVLQMPVQKNQYGKGRVVYIPEIKPAIPKIPSETFSGKYWKLPINANEMIESVVWAGNNTLPIKVEAPLTVTMELAQKEDNSALILHLVNFGFRFGDVKNIKVDVQVPEGKKVKQVTVITPDGRENDVIKFKQTARQTSFTVPRLTVYDVVDIRFE
jgi:hypothetical protein